MAKPVLEIAERAGPPRLARRGGHFCFKTLETLILPKETVTSISKEWADYPAFQHTPIFIFDHNHGVFVARNLELLEKRVEDKECMYKLKAVDGTQVAVATLYAINSHEEVAKAVSSVQQGGGYYGHFPSTIGFTKVGKIQTWIISRFYGTIFDTVLYKSLPAPAGLHWYFPGQ
ncbi:hypothetical protein FRC03_000576 [Tulasnella sp. 419]|nr:hypothetical protein FRC03_000576 [Tulasnella sp. 419]